MSSKLKQRNKPYRFTGSGKHPYKTIRKVFFTYDLDTMREELELWKEISLSNDRGIYEDAETRENLLLYCRSLVRLAEGLFLINKRKFSRKKKTNNKIYEFINSAIGSNNKHRYLTNQEQEDPFSLIRVHFKSFSFAYSKIELEDMLEAVISYEGKIKVDKVYLIVFYRCLNALLKSAYAIERKGLIDILSR